MNERIRIKDIAEKSGVSVGTVDRILHNRPNVSKTAREKVEAVLKSINYQPNMYASALAYNKSYTFFCIIPQYESEAYWEEIEEGMVKATENRRDFHINAEILKYRRFDTDAYHKICQKCLDCNPNGVVLVPSDLEETKNFTDKLHERDIPFVLLDSYIPEVQPLSFYGQDSFCSGYFSAKILMLIASNDKEICLMRQTKNGKLASKQQENREVGFKHFMQDHFPAIKIKILDLPLDKNKKDYDIIMDKFFSQNPNIHNCVTLCSKAFLVGEYLLRTNRRNVQIMGYDMIGRNAKCLRLGSMSFLIAQHAYMQGFNCIDTLFRAIVLKKKVAPINYMPIELLTKENADFYRRTQL
ncbi:MAG: substrate-binding domain-containing protein [Prevotella sp.]|nr:substrate-binding domain-containing protein [Prevotella sp.]